MSFKVERIQYPQTSDLDAFPRSSTHHDTALPVETLRSLCFREHHVSKLDLKKETMNTADATQQRPVWIQTSPGSFQAMPGTKSSTQNQSKIDISPGCFVWRGGKSGHERGRQCAARCSHNRQELGQPQLSSNYYKFGKDPSSEYTKASQELPWVVAQRAILDLELGSPTWTSTCPPCVNFNNFQ